MPTFNRAYVAIRYGQAYDGFTPDFDGSPVSIMGIARELRVTEGGKQTDVAGAGSGYELNEYHTKNGKLSMRGVVNASEDPYTFAEVGGTSKLHYYIEVTRKALSAHETGSIHVGVVTQYEYSGTRDAEQIESIEVDLNPSYTAPPSP